MIEYEDNLQSKINVNGKIRRFNLERNKNYYILKMKYQISI